MMPSWDLRPALTSYVAGDIISHKLLVAKNWSMWNWEKNRLFPSVSSVVLVYLGVCPHL